MNALQAEKSEITDEDKNLAAVTEVEAGIRDFVPQGCCLSPPHACGSCRRCDSGHIG